MIFLMLSKNAYATSSVTITFLSQYYFKRRSPTLQVDSLPSESLGKPKNTGVGSLSLLQEIYPTQESNRGLLHCRWILYQLSYQGRPWYGIKHDEKCVRMVRDHVLLQYGIYWRENAHTMMISATRYFNRILAAFERTTTATGGGYKIIRVVK